MADFDPCFQLCFLRSSCFCPLLHSGVTFSMVLRWLPSFQALYSRQDNVHRHGDWLSCGVPRNGKDTSSRSPPSTSLYNWLVQMRPHVYSHTSSLDQRNATFWGGQLWVPTPGGNGVPWRPAWTVESPSLKLESTPQPRDSTQRWGSNEYSGAHQSVYLIILPFYFIKRI